MANLWLRLYHDMPNDPKWRTIARVSKQPIPLVLAVYLHLLVIASQATDRGAVMNVSPEDIASALDADSAAIEAVLVGMNGRVIDDDRLSGWDKRQVAREDGASERAKKWREKRTHANANERKRTHANANERQIKSREEEIKNKKEQKPSAAPAGARVPDPRHTEFRDAFERYFLHKSPSLTEAPWDAQEAAHLSRFLKKNPNFTTEQWKSLLQNRARSDVAHAENISAWIGRALTWAHEPTKKGNFNGKATITDSLSAKQAVLDARRARRMADEPDCGGGIAETGFAALGTGGEQHAAGFVLEGSVGDRQP